MEHLDQPDREKVKSLVGFAAKSDAVTTARFESKLLGGVMVLEHPATLDPVAGRTGLYVADEQPGGSAVPSTLRLIPYYAWANRASSAMQVWIPETKA
jgi:DUF1680 family protein